MKKIHNQLMRSSGWYRRWHLSKENNVLTWMIFLLYSVMATVVVSTSILATTV